jgi:DNA-binding response OmpR family regulator
MTDRLAFPPELGLTPTEIEIATVLVLRERVAGEVLIQVIHGDRGKKPKITAVKTHVSHLRKKFAKLDLRIDTVWGWGWKMPAADREKLRELSREPPVARTPQASR